MSGTKPNNDKNRFENSTSKGNSPPSGKGSPPAVGAHKAKFIDHGGDESIKQKNGVHESLRKPKLMQ